MSLDRLESVLVTGASGFVGACAARSLLDRGHAVHVLLRDPKRAGRLHDILRQLIVHCGDTRDVESVRSCLASAKPEVVLHLATRGAYESQSDADAILATNILGTQNLLQAAADAGVSLFVQTGSSSEYGFQKHPMRETDRLEPNSVYAVAKAAQTHLGQLWSRRGSMPVVCLRLFSVYGPWEEPTRLIPTLIRQARARRPLDLTSPETARDFVYVDDVLDALLDFPRLRTLGGEVINIASGRETKLREIVAEVLRLFPGRPELRWGAFPARQWDAAHWSGDIAKAERLLGWTPRHTLAEGLAKTAAWMQITGGEDADFVLRAVA
jgi:nucleoside-diphosphate-sugar epimerase